MAILKIKDAKKLSPKDRKQKIADLKFELTKANVTANKTNAKTKEIKKALARLLTLQHNEIAQPQAQKKNSKEVPQKK